MFLKVLEHKQISYLLSHLIRIRLALRCYLLGAYFQFWRPSSFDLSLGCLGKRSFIDIGCSTVLEQYLVSLELLVEQSSKHHALLERMPLFGWYWQYFVGLPWKGTDPRGKDEGPGLTPTGLKVSRQKCILLGLPFLKGRLLRPRRSGRYVIIEGYYQPFPWR